MQLWCASQVTQGCPSVGTSVALSPSVIPVCFLQGVLHLRPTGHLLRHLAPSHLGHLKETRLMPPALLPPCIKAHPSLCFQTPTKHTQREKSVTEQPLNVLVHKTQTTARALPRHWTHVDLHLNPLPFAPTNSNAVLLSSPAWKIPQAKWLMALWHLQHHLSKVTRF